GSVAMSALIGRVPVDGTVNDPYPFKVLIGDGAFDGQRLQQLHHYARSSLSGLDLERQIRLNTLSARV
ncbi:hypothetical protein Pgy4_36510, partial [Pseudomonas savastanoi pv. glycinea str. race 4]